MCSIVVNKCTCSQQRTDMLYRESKCVMYLYLISVLYLRELVPKNTVPLISFFFFRFEETSQNPRRDTHLDSDTRLTLLLVLIIFNYTSLYIYKILHCPQFRLIGYEQTLLQIRVQQVMPFQFSLFRGSSGTGSWHVSFGQTVHSIKREVQFHPSSDTTADNGGFTFPMNHCKVHKRAAYPFPAVTFSSCLLSS